MNCRPPKRRKIRVYKERTARFGSFTKEYILSMHKSIGENECWISDYKLKDNGYINITIGGNKYYLHRVVMCLWNDIDYHNRVLALHKCNNKLCFNPEHLKPGTKSENAYDSVKAGTNHNANKEACSKCGLKYITRVQGKLVKKKICYYCNNEKRREKRAKENESL